MSDYDRNLRDPNLRDPMDPSRPNFRDPVDPVQPTPTSASSSSWIGAAALVVLLLIAVGYVFSNRSTNNTGLIEHRAAATDTGPTVTMTPAPTPSKSPVLPDAPKNP